SSTDSRKRHAEGDSDDFNKKLRTLDDKYSAKFQDLELQIAKSKHTITPALDIGSNVIRKADIDLKFFIDRFQATPTVNIKDFIFSSPDLGIVCKIESDTQKKFNTFFSKLALKKEMLKQKMPWTIHDSSIKGFLKDPIGKIDFSILDGSAPSWVQLVSAIELKLNIGDKKDAAGKALSDEHH
ncbi:hypothetical protein BGX27_005863, partial [Mortierella sp. AM989]